MQDGILSKRASSVRSQCWNGSEGVHRNKGKMGLPVERKRKEVGWEAPQEEGWLQTVKDGHGFLTYSICTLISNPR